ncbi:hypothetical protein D0Z25_00230, partial [Staphylococcus epidermidis]|nr:hypothetical protein [Staphylococcus epidermidis]
KKDKFYIISIEFVFFTYPETLCNKLIFFIFTEFKIYYINKLIITKFFNKIYYFARIYAKIQM